MKVWICTKGEYSEQHVIGVYSDKAVAERVAQSMAWNDPEEFDLDPPIPPEAAAGMNHYQVMIVKDTGAVCPGNPRIADPDCSTWIKDGVEWATPQHGAVMLFRVWARDGEHAIKAARDKRIQKLAGQ